MAILVFRLKLSLEFAVPPFCLFLLSTSGQIVWNSFPNCELLKMDKLVFLRHTYILYLRTSNPFAPCLGK